MLSWSWVSFETAAKMEGFLECSGRHSNGGVEAAVTLVGRSESVYFD